MYFIDPDGREITETDNSFKFTGNDALRLLGFGAPKDPPKKDPAKKNETPLMLQNPKTQTYSPPLPTAIFRSETNKNLNEAPSLMALSQANTTLGAMDLAQGNTGVDFSLAGMYMHFQFGGGKSITIKMSSIDFSGTSQEVLGLFAMNVGDVRAVNLFNAGSTNPAALAFGRVNMKYHGNNQFSIISDKSSRFDFSPLYDPKASLGRNVGNTLGTMINYNLFPHAPVSPLVPLIFGGPYDVKFSGTTTIPE